MDDELLRLIGRQPKVVPYVDIPFQHAARRVLRAMARRGDGAEYLTLLARARELIPSVSLRSTFIVGFPGETDEDFEELLDFVARGRLRPRRGLRLQPGGRHAGRAAEAPST